MSANTRFARHARGFHASRCTAKLLAAVTMLGLCGPAHGKAGAVPSLAAVITHQSVLSRSSYLDLLVGSQRIDTAILLRGLSSGDPGVRKIAAEKLSEVPSSELDQRVVSALIETIRDSDNGVANQAVASIIRIGRIKPELLIPLVDDKRKLRQFKYESRSANQMRTLSLTAADVAIIALYHGRPVGLSRLKRSYDGAKASQQAATSTRGTRADGVDGVDGDYGPAKSETVEFFEASLRALLPLDADANRTLVMVALHDKDSAVREIAYVAAGKISAKRAPFVAALSATVRSHPELSDRTEAAMALTQLGDQGRAELVRIAKGKDALARSAAFSALVSEDGCDSTFSRQALSDPDKRVLEATIRAILYSPAEQLPVCLFPLVPNESIDHELRQRILEAMTERGSEKQSTDTMNLPGLAGPWNPILINPKSALFADAWRALRAAQRGGREIPPGIVKAAAQVLGSADIDAVNEDLLCTVSGVPHDALLTQHDLPRDLARLAGQEQKSQSFLSESVDECLAEGLQKIQFGKPEYADLRASLFKALEKQEALAASAPELIDRWAPPELFEQDWRSLAQKSTGAARLAIFRIAASRGIAVDEAQRLFQDVLSGKTDGLGLNASDHGDLQYDLRYTFMPAAVDGLVASGDGGRAILSQILSGGAGTSLSRSVIAIDLCSSQPGLPSEIRKQNASLLWDGFVAMALHDKDAEVRGDAVMGLACSGRLTEIAPAIRPLLQDPDKSVVYQISDLIRGRNGVSNEGGQVFGKSLSPADAQTFISTMLVVKYDYAREDTAETMAHLKERLPSSFVVGALIKLLEDPAERVRGSTLDTIGVFGADGAQALGTALAGPRASELFVYELVPAISGLQKDAHALCPQLMALQKAFRVSAPLIDGLAAQTEQCDGAQAVFEEELASDDAAVQTAAVNALSRRQTKEVISSNRYLASLVDVAMPARVEKMMGDVLEDVRPYYGAVPMSAHFSRLPPFPWPPPAWSFKEPIPAGLLGGPHTNLGHVSDDLIAALRRASPDYDYGLFGIPDGFVLLARLEHIHPNGDPLPGLERWSTNPTSPQSVDDYFIDLFLDPPGYFRIVAFAVTGAEPSEPDNRHSLPEMGSGLKTLPDSLAAEPLADRQIIAFVYTYARYDGMKLTLNYEGSPSGHSHLVAAGIWGALQKLSSKH